MKLLNEQDSSKTIDNSQELLKVLSSVIKDCNICSDKIKNLLGVDTPSNSTDADTEDTTSKAQQGNRIYDFYNKTR